MKIILYSTETCPKCKILKKKLDAKNIQYETNMNIDEMQKLGISGVPVLNIDGQLLNFSTANTWVNDQ